jgi:hypothetical protein
MSRRRRMFIPLLKVTYIEGTKEITAADNIFTWAIEEASAEFETSMSARREAKFDHHNVDNGEG